MLLPFLEIRSTQQMGRGVYTTEAIDKNEILEISPVIIMSKKDQELIDKTLLYYYIFEWGKNSEKCCMALGWVPIYNHAFEANCEYIMDYETETIQIKSVRKINAGEQLFINYNGEWNNKSPVWFEVK